jgi:hypothetical protein
MRVNRRSLLLESASLVALGGRWVFQGVQCSSPDRSVPKSNLNL